MSIFVASSNFYRSTTRKRGFTLVEIAIVLGVIGIILGGIWAAAGGVYAGANANKVAQQLGMYVASVRSSCSNGTCTGTTIPSSVTASLPSIPGATITAAILQTATGSYQAGGAMTIDFTNLPTSNSGAAFCNGVVSAITALGGGSAESSAAAMSAGTVQSATCDNTTSNAPTCPANTTAITWAKSGSGTCAAGKTTLASGSMSCTPSQVVACTTTTQVGGVLSLSY